MNGEALYFNFSVSSNENYFHISFASLAYPIKEIESNNKKLILPRYLACFCAEVYIIRFNRKFKKGSYNKSHLWQAIDP